jgi:serine/threonine protein kinase
VEDDGEAGIAIAVIIPVVGCLCLAGAAAAVFFAVRRKEPSSGTSADSGASARPLSAMNGAEKGGSDLFSPLNSRGVKIVADVEVTAGIDGDSSDCFRAAWHGSDVLIRAVGPFSATTEDASDFFGEVALLQKLNHPSVVRLLGVCQREDVVVGTSGVAVGKSPAFLVTEFYAEGNLRAALQTSAVPADGNSLVSYVSQASAAVAYIHSEDVSHNNLSAAVFLVKRASEQSFALVLSEFGMSGFGDYVRTVDVTFHFSCPEALTGGKVVAKKSDVFALASTAIEITGLGVPPYAELGTNEAVIDAIKSGCYPKQPNGCSNELYAALLPCWAAAPDMRPSSAELSGLLSELVCGDDASSYVDATLVTGNNRVTDYQGNETVDPDYQ